MHILLIKSVPQAKLTSVISVLVLGSWDLSLQSAGYKNQVMRAHFAPVTGSSASCWSEMGKRARGADDDSSKISLRLPRKG